MNIKDIEQYFSNVVTANSELAKKELLKTLLVRLFDTDAEARNIIDKMDLGSEKTIFNIPLKERVKTGSADSQYNNIIIEWEKDLNKTGEHAKEQLAEYVAGNWKSGEDYNFVLIATDGERWEVHAPNYEKLIHKKSKLLVTDIVLKTTDKFILTKNNLSEFFFFLDRYLFKTNVQPATLENITLAFGETSQVFLNTMNAMTKYLPDIKNDSTVFIAYEQWKKFLEIAYGKFDDSQEVFFVHTYLSIFAKIIAYKIISNDDYIDSKELEGILDGSIFNKYHVERFVDNDFYSWISQKKHIKTLLPAFKKITQRITEFDFHNVKEDILKGVYQELIDLETRHSLGEYYTPDWLCERIVDGLHFKEDSNILDPACGSGSFLRAAIVKLQKDFPKLPVDKILEQVVGIDIHPLSVQVAKTTILIALGKVIQKLRKPIALNVYLANSLRLPLGSAELFGQTFEVTIDRKQYPMENSIFENPSDFDNSIELCNSIAEFETQQIDERKFNAQLRAIITSDNESHFYNFYKIYVALRQAKLEQRDTIWKFILQNLYKPILLKQRFDFIIGNPPWLTYADVTDASYQNELLQLSTSYGVTPRSKANMPHLEIASIFLAHSCNYFLKPHGKLAFVLPRAFLTADQHDNTRSGGVQRVRITSVWDLVSVSPLFRVPSCVMFAEVGHVNLRSKREIPKTGIHGFLFSGKLKNTNTHWEEAKQSLIQNKTSWYYSKLSQGNNGRSALTTQQLSGKNQKSYYSLRFRQGATIVPRTFYFVTPEQELSKNLNDAIIQCKTVALPEAKVPWKDLTIRGRINTKYLFRTALSKNIIPFALINPLFVLLPIAITEVEGKKNISLLKSGDIFKRGDRETGEWFKEAEGHWESNKTERNKEEEVNVYDYLNWQNKLTQQNLNAKYLVLYTASAKDANAVVVERENIDLEFMIDYTTYWLTVTSLKEAHYLASYLNCGYANKLIKDFQARGLFGPRHISKTILELPFPQYDSKNPLHIELAKLGEQCAKKISKVVEFEKEVEGVRLGNARLNVRRTLSEELKEIDGLVEKVLGK